jgi:hypothetical protein
MRDAPTARRGVVSALLGLARNLGLITGASAMGAVFALAGGGLTGLEATFGLGAVLAGVSLCLTLVGSSAAPRV